MSLKLLSNTNGVPIDLAGGAKNLTGEMLVSAERIPVGSAGYDRVNAGAYLIEATTEGGAALEDWLSLTSDSVARQRSGAAYYDGKIYVYGGQTATSIFSSYSRALRVYDIATDTWSALTECPNQGYTGILHPSVVAYQGKLYVYGGLTGNGRGWVYIYDIATDTWSQGLDGADSWGHTAIVYNGKMYVFGGSAGDYTAPSPMDSLRVYDIATDTWGAGEPDTGGGGRVYHSAALCGTKMLVFGGVQGGVPVSSLSVLDLVSGEWSSGAADTIGGSRYQHVSIGNDYGFFVQGGLDGTSTYLDSVRIYNLSSQVWGSGPSDSLTGGARTRHVGVSSGAYFYTFGGYPGGALTTELHAAEIISGGGLVFRMEGTGIEDNDNPYVQVDPLGVTFDGVTQNKNLLPGWDIVISSGVEPGDKFVVCVGCASIDTTPERIISHGLLIDGVSSRDAIPLAVQNKSAHTLTNCSVVATNAARIVNSASFSRPISALWQTGLLNPTADETPDGTGISFANYASGTPSTVDILLGGISVDVYDVAADELIPGGTGLSCDGTTVYRFADRGPYQSITFVLASDLDVSDTATLFISPGGDAIEVSLDGVSFVSGPSGIAAGTLSALSSADFFLRLFVSSGMTPDMNQMSYSLRAYGLDADLSPIESEVIGSLSVMPGLSVDSETVSGGPSLTLRIRCVQQNRAIPVGQPGAGGTYDSVSEILAENGVTFSDD